DALPHGASRRISARYQGGRPRDRAPDGIRLRGFRDQGFPAALWNLTRRLSKECDGAERRQWRKDRDGRHLTAVRSQLPYRFLSHGVRAAGPPIMWLPE